MCPGFVDSHVHLSETLSRAVFPDNLNTRAWVFHWAKPFYAHITEEDEYWGALLGITEMLRNGTTCFIDMGSQYDPGITVARDGADRHPRHYRPACRRQPARRAAARLDRGDGEAPFLPERAGGARGARSAACASTTARSTGACAAGSTSKARSRARSSSTSARSKLAERLGVGTTYHLATSIEEAKVCEAQVRVLADHAHRPRRRHRQQPRDRPRRRGQRRRGAAAGRTRHQGRVLPVLVVQARQGRDGDRQVPGDGRAPASRWARHRRRLGGRQHEPDAADATSSPACSRTRG